SGLHFSVGNAHGSRTWPDLLEADGPQSVFRGPRAGIRWDSGLRPKSPGTDAADRASRRKSNEQPRRVQQTEMSSSLAIDPATRPANQPAIQVDQPILR